MIFFITLLRYFTIVLFFTLHFFSFSQGMQTRERAHCARSVFPFIKKKKKKKVSDLVCPAWSCLAPSFVLVLCLTLAAVVAQVLDCAVSAGSWSPTGSQLPWMTVIVACWPAFSIRLWCLLGSVIFSSSWAVYLLPGWPWFWAFGLRCSRSSLAVLSLWCR